MIRCRRKELESFTYWSEEYERLQVQLKGMAKELHNEGEEVSFLYYRADSRPHNSRRQKPFHF